MPHRLRNWICLTKPNAKLLSGMAKIGIQGKKVQGLSSAVAFKAIFQIQKLKEEAPFDPFMTNHLLPNPKIISQTLQRESLPEDQAVNYQQIVSY